MSWAWEAIFTSGYGQWIEADPLTGAYRKTVDAGCNVEAAGQPLLWDGVLYFPTGNRGVLALDPASFSVLHAFPTGKAKIFTVPYLRGPQKTVESSPIALDGLLVFAGSDGVLYRYRPDGTLVKKEDVGAAVTADLLVTDRAIITVDFAGRVTAYPRAVKDGKDGKRK